MYRGKYVIGLALDDIDNRRLEAILFSSTMTHKHAAELFGFGEYVVSAGFFSLHVTRPEDLSGDGTVMTAGGKVAVSLSGESETLQLGRQPLDDFYIKRALGLIEEREFTQDKRKADYSTGYELVRLRRLAERDRKLG